jgi:hypothetical protein
MLGRAKKPLKMCLQAVDTLLGTVSTMSNVLTISSSSASDSPVQTLTTLQPGEPRLPHTVTLTRMISDSPLDVRNVGF